MRRPGFLDSLRTGSKHFDEQTTLFIQTHFNLIMALAALALSIWGLAAGQPMFVIAMIIIGAISYFTGIFTGLMAGIVSILISLFVSLHNGFHTPVELIEIVGYVCVAWLGYGHKVQKEQEAQRTNKHQDQVVPWAVLNEVRTSLAAVRFLLFPLHGNDDDQELEKVSKELSRLEHLFIQIESEKKQQQSK